MLATVAMSSVVDRLIGRPKAAVDVDGFWKNGYTIVRGAYDPHEIEQFRRGVAASTGPKGDLLANPELRSVLTDGRLIRIARTLLDAHEIMYAGDSSFTIGNQQHGYHKDNADRLDGDAPDWQGRYTVLRFGVYLQDHWRHTGGLNLRVGSHNSPSVTEGPNVYVRTRVGDVAVWSLRTSHSGNGTLLQFPRWVHPEPSKDGEYPKWWRVAQPDGSDRMALFAALGLDDHHHDRYTDYLKTREYIVRMWGNSVYSDEALREAAAAGLKVRDVPREVIGDTSAGQNVTWKPLPY